MMERAPVERSELTELIRLRRMFHKNPEAGFAEFWTTARICEYLKPMKCRLFYGNKLKDCLSEQELLTASLNQDAYTIVKTKNHNDKWIQRLNGITGAVAVIKGKTNGPKFGFRFDIDGLPIAESKDRSHLPLREGFSSVNGLMHACGHDGHIAIGLGFAKRLAAKVDQLEGEYFLLFQPAEEVIMGGKIFAGLNFISSLDYFIPIHLGLKNERQIVCGLSFLADRRYHVSFAGKSAHSAAFPEKGRNALLAACHAITGLYALSRHSDGYSRVNVGGFRSENAVNIVADKVEFDLDLRGQYNHICQYMAEQAQNVIKGAAKMQNVKCEMTLVSQGETADNSPQLMSLMRKASADIGIPDNKIFDKYLISASEDACFIMNKVMKSGGLSTYICLGSPTYGGHHNEKFDFEEDILLDGVKLLYQFVENMQAKNRVVKIKKLLLSSTT